MKDNYIPIFLASNDRYAPFVATTIASVCYNTKSFCNFYVLDSGITQLNKNRINELKNRFNNFSIEFLEIDLKKFENFQLLDHISLDTYSRFFIPDLKPQLDKVIYLDVDVVAMDDITKLYDIDLGEHFIGAIPEYFNVKNQEKIAKRLDIDIVEEKKFFNAGVLLINSKKWRENNICSKLLDIQKKYESVITYGDQDILIKQFYNDYLELDFKFNLTSTQLKFKNEYSNEIEKKIDESYKNIVIRHFETQAKPWVTNKNFYGGELQNFQDFWFYAELTNFYKNISEFYKSANNLQNNDNTIYSNSSIKPIIRARYSVKLFGILPIFKIIRKQEKIYIKLFNFIPVLIIINKMK